MYQDDSKLGEWAKVVEDHCRALFAKAHKNRGQAIRDYQKYVASDVCKRVLEMLGVDKSGRIKLAWTLDSG